MHKERLIVAAIGVGSLLASNPAMAAETATASASSSSAITVAQAETTSSASPASAGRSIEEVVVTARRREESVQSVPLAVTAISGETLQRNNVNNVLALSTQVPSLVIIPGPSADRTSLNFSIRGLNQQDQTVFSDPSVAVYINDIVVPRPQGANGGLYDIQSVEVLKGPQGTLFGKNSPGGAVNIRFNRPSREFEGYVGGTVGNYGELDSDVMVNAPLSDHAQLRFAGQTIRNDGWLEDVLLDDMINEKNSKAGRLSLALQPTEGMDSVFVYSRFVDDGGGTGAIVTDINLQPPSLLATFGPRLGYTGDNTPSNVLAAQQQRDYKHTASGLPQSSDVSTWDLANTTTYELNDQLSVKNIVATRHLDAHNVNDPDGTPLPLVHINVNVEGKVFSEELQLLGKTESTDWIVGGYYFRETGFGDNYSYSLASLAATGIAPQPAPSDTSFWSVTRNRAVNSSKAAFAQGTRKLDGLLEGLSATLGGRYTQDTREATVENRAKSAATGLESCRFTVDADGNPATPEVRPAIEDCSLTKEKDFSKITYNGSVDWKITPHNLVYLASRKGYRSGAFTARPTTEAGFTATPPETVTDYEIGTKNDFSFNDMALRTNVALYTADYQDVQRLLTRVENNNGIVTPSTVLATGDATIQGLEVDFTFMPTDAIELSGFYSYTDAKFNKLQDPITGADFSKNPFARAPKNISSLTVRYQLPVPSSLGQISTQLNYWHTDEYSGSDDFVPQVMNPAYELVNFRTDWRSLMGTNFDVGVFVKNVIDREYGTPNNTLYGSGVGNESISPGEPRTYGLDVKYRFGALGS